MKKKQGGVTFDISVGEFSERTILTVAFYEELVALMAAKPYSLGRLFEIGARAVMTAASGDPFAGEFIESTRPKPPPRRRPVRQANQPARRRSPARRAKAGKRSKASARSS
jgi:hypothetical protein